MPTNANTFNSRVTSEALEAKFRDVFPAQGGAELVQDLFASGVIQPVVDFSSVAEGSVLSTNLQTAWDFSTGANQISSTTTNIITNTGFWRVQGVVTMADLDAGAVAVASKLQITDGATTKPIWATSLGANTQNNQALTDTFDFVVFLRTGDILQGFTIATAIVMDVSYRQIADVNGNLVNPLGFTFS